MLKTQILLNTLQKIASESDFMSEVANKSKIDAVRKLRADRGGKIPENAPQWVRAGGNVLLGRHPGAIAGALGVELAANIIGRHLGKKAPVRTTDEQSSYEAKAKIANWLLPGVASYRRARSNKYYDELEKKYFESK